MQEKQNDTRTFKSSKPGLLSAQVSERQSRYFFLNRASQHRQLTAGVSGYGLALGGCEHCNPDYRIDRPGFAYHVLEYVVEGSGWVTLGDDGIRYSLGAGSVFVCRRQTRCIMGTEAGRPMVKYFLCFAGEGGVRKLTQEGLVADTVRVLSTQGEVRSVLDDLVREGRRPGPRAAETCGILFEMLRLKINEALLPQGRTTASSGDESGRDIFLRCKALIDARSEDLMSLKDLATEAHVDASSICRLFKRYQGISPYQYLLRRKMNVAAEFLVDGRGLVKEAAQRVGFADPLHFSRVFRSIHGVAPSEMKMRREKRTTLEPVGADES